MSSSIVFHGYHHDGSNGLIEYILDLCIREFEQVEGCKSDPYLKTFFQCYRERFFSGLYVFLDEDAIRSPSDALYLSYLFERVFTLLQQPDSKLTEHGRTTVATELLPLVGRLRKYATGTLPHANEA